MVALSKLKSRFLQIKNTEKITKAMELISNAKIPKLRREFVQVSQYFTNLNEIFLSIIKKTTSINVFDLDTTKPRVFIVITSDLGLCGAYNVNVVKKLKSLIKEEDRIIVIGKKGISYLSKFKNQIDLEFDVVDRADRLEIIFKVKEQIEKYLENKQISGIEIIYTQFINTLTFNAINFTLLPIDKNIEQQKLEFKQNSKLEIEFEPSPESVLKNLIPIYFGAALNNFLFESKISEIASRRIAMENASDNANEIIDKLSIELNRTRQASITQEITEIVGSILK
ncbi:ATP synthase F1 subunit gamma [Mesomycoplasma hyorhinis]|uniref:ATP synthase gamma chain n=3 Tax=Mesomycoplasma hyorhinis TaxID=2100 RepID=A0ABD6IE82_MESHY|nr:ATP synthase F1 subunit gamma [Mesomycoplasma hyorhinis]AEC45738.1 ATP synthase gamma chain [Mesomycoplasma hyorhinis MCLD]AEX14136.1 ATP synthase F1, gamma subunit [Mesomycoplasma hyorhinis GDL-1]AFX74177.1 ATP synthase gamma chain [Mesomycoplasma hyorhinis SK76]AHA41133.1 ATP synthase F1, gamma subunit [Mesomycoplasma hyorhinis DBS 1050]TRM74413.1 ATP synthase F1 subunit gamma [Sulfolobus sp. A20-N-F8]TRM83097.1 ATP synthase F1 subunit gamma [Sulfolobus sp. A20-N-F6]